MGSKVFFSVLAVFVCGVASQQVVPGPCPDLPAVPNFNLTAYLGKWHEVEKTSFLEEFGAICIEANYADFGNGSIEVFNTQIIEATGEPSSIRGNARPLDSNSTDAKFLVSFPGVGAYDAPYWVMDTDFDNFSIVWACRPYNQNSFQTLWFLSRQKNPSSEIRDRVHNKMAELGLTDILTLVSTVQEGCPDSQE